MIVADQKSGKIIDISFANGKTHDFEMLKAIKDKFRQEVRFIADSGFQGIRKLFPKSKSPFKKSKNKPLSNARKQFNKTLSQERILIEHIIGRIKTFRMFKTQYRDRRIRVNERMTFLACLCNLQY